MTSQSIFPDDWSDLIESEVPFRIGPDVIALGDLREVKDVQYVAAVYDQWSGDIADKNTAELRDNQRSTSSFIILSETDLGHREKKVQFNWISVFNFHSDALMLALEVAGSVEALMQLKIGHVVRCPGECRPPLVYISFLEVAPANLTAVAIAPTRPRRGRGLGSAMVRLSCDASRQRGYEGRVGLHSVAGAVDFYRRLGFRPLDCSNEYHELYMELDADGARALLKD
jgi:ribosomal protein S18 acetylase RimI-like enzyme